MAYLLGGGIGSLAAAAFMIRDGSMPGGNISILEGAPVLGGSLDGTGDPAVGYSLRGGRMLRACCPINNHYSIALMVTDLIVYGSHDGRRRLAGSDLELSG